MLDFERRLKTSLGLTKQQNPQKVILSLSYKNQKSHAETEPRIWTQFGAKAAQLKLSYHSVLSDEKEIPTWIDAVLKKALQPNSNKRYQVLSESLYDLRHPNKSQFNTSWQPLIERNPILFWQSLLFFLSIIVLILILKSK